MKKLLTIEWCLETERNQWKAKNIYFLRFLERRGRAASTGLVDAR